MKNLHSLQSFTLHRIVFHGNQSLLKLRDFEINYLLFFLEFYFTNLSLVDTSLVVSSCLHSSHWSCQTKISCSSAALNSPIFRFRPLLNCCDEVFISVSCSLPCRILENNQVTFWILKTVRDCYNVGFQGIGGDKLCRLSLWAKEELCGSKSV